MSSGQSESVQITRAHTPLESASLRTGLVGLFAVLSLLTACTTPPPRPLVPETREPVAMVAESPALPSETGNEVKPGIKLAASPEMKPPPAPAVSAEDHNVFFEQGLTVVSPSEKEKLRQHGQRLKQNPKTYVTLTGYSDDLGSRNYKLAIAEERLAAVSKLLRSYGASPSQIRRNRSASVKNPPSCSTDDCLRMRRRVELVYPK